MKDSHERLFEYLKSKEPPAELLNSILVSVKGRTSSRVLIVRTVVSGALSLVAITALVPSLLIAQSEISRSDFYQFLSLLLSDTNTVMTFWKEFTLSLMESFPTLGMIAVLGSVFVFLVSVRFFIRDMVTIMHQPRLGRNY